MFSQFQLMEENQKTVPLQAIQTSIYTFEKLYPKTSTYHHTVAMELKGDLHVEIFKTAIIELLNRHEALRSHIIEINGQPVQNIKKEIHPSPNWPLKLIEAKPDYPVSIQHLSDILRKENEEEIIYKPFDLHDGPLWRCVLIKLKNNEYQFLMVFHHIIIDIHSQNLLLKDLSQIYNSFLEKYELRLPIKPALIEVKKIEKETKKIEFWKHQLQDFTLPALHPEFLRQKQNHFKGDRLHFTINSIILEKLKEIANKNSVTLHMTLLASLYVLLYRYTGQTDLCIGTTSANRRDYNVDINNIVNCFINSVPLRIDLNGDPTFDHLLQRIKTLAVKSYQHQLPIDRIIDKTIPKSPFSLMFVLYPQKNSLTLKNIEAGYPIELNLRHAKFDVTIVIDEYTHECLIEFNTDLFQHTYFQRFKGHLETLWEGIINSPNSPISNLPLLTESEKEILKKHNETNKDPHFIEFTHELFSKRAKENPDKIALVYHEEKKDDDIPRTKKTITYSTLDKITDKLAAYLTNIGVEPEITVGVSIKRSINLIIAMLAIYKAGGVVVPMETTDAPLLHYKISDTNLNVIFVDNDTKQLFCEYEPGVFLLNVDDMKSIMHVIDELDLNYSKPTDLSPHNLAYIRYTSGTAQFPKGVMICHSGLTNLANALADRISLKPGSNVISTAQATFDAFEFDLLETWITGGTLHLINDSDNFSVEDISEIIMTEKINVATMLPHFMKRIGKKTLSTLNDLVSMGDVADKKLIADLSKEKNLVIRNEWGVTEATVCNTENSNLKGIGKPIRNTQIYIINPVDGKNECPIGVPGEIWIAGAGLARGYVGNPELTSSQFPLKILKRDKRCFEDPEIKNIDYKPVSEYDGHPRKKIKYIPKTITYSNDLFPIYKTGDLGCRLEDGSIDFVGRINGKQMKIKGVRVDLTSIETVLASHPEIKQAIVIPYPGQIYPVAYVMSHQKQLTKKDLNSFLSHAPLQAVAKLSAVVCLDNFPLTYHGKINIKAFPSPIFDAEMKIAMPQTELQISLKKIWSDLLKIPIDSFGIYHDFSQLGGDSFSFANLGIKINSTLPLKSPVNITLLSLDDTIEEMENKLRPFLTEYHSHRLFKSSITLENQPVGEYKSTITTSLGSVSDCRQTLVK